MINIALPCIIINTGMGQVILRILINIPDYN